MKRFLLPELLAPTYDGTLFSNLTIVDERHPTIIQHDPIPPLSRLIAFGGAEVPVFDGPRTIHGHLDLRYRRNFVGKLQSSVEFAKLLEWLEKAKAQGDICGARKSTSLFPVMVMKWHRRGEATDAAVLIAIQGWSALPLYFSGEFEAFSQVVDRLRNLVSEILQGTAASETDHEALE